jgi:hypothetical protein
VSHDIGDQLTHQVARLHDLLDETHELRDRTQLLRWYFAIAVEKARGTVTLSQRSRVERSYRAHKDHCPTC